MFIPHAESARKAACSDKASPSRRIDPLRGSHGVFATLTAVAALLAAIRPAPAAPRGGSVVEGSATISQSGPVTNIDQSTNRAVIDWLGFSIGAGETVNFHQPTNLSVTLNRVIGNESSVIAGALNANGRVFLVNSNGVLFTKDAQVNVGGLVASTLDISNRDFMAGNFRFSGSSNAAIVNRGEIRASEGGYVALLGRTVSNEGAITATLGSIALAAGDKITLNFGGDSLIDVSIDKGTYKALVDNKGLVEADGGRVVMTAKAADAVLSAQVNNSGIVQARTLADLVGGSSTPRGSARVGSIELLASGGRTKVSGKLDASAPRGGRGGVIDTSGDKVTIADGAVITTKSANGRNGDWIIDPDGFTIAASGGDITGAALGAQLESNNVTIYSTQGNGDSGDIDVNDAVQWAASTTLTFNATRNIDIAAPIYATGAGAGLVLNTGGYASTGAASEGTDYRIGAEGSISLLGENASLSINGQAYMLIRTMEQLARISAPVLDENGRWSVDPDGNPIYTVAEGHYALARDLDAAGVTYSAPPIIMLRGTLAGLGHTIDSPNVVEAADGASFGAGFIGTIGRGAVVRDLGLLNADIHGASFTAGLAVVNAGLVDNVFVTGALNGAGETGGLVAENAGTIANSYTDLAITGAGTYTGGLVAVNYAEVANSTSNGTITVAAVTLPDGGFVAADYVGGFVGFNYGAISDSQANVNVSGADISRVGGFAGGNDASGSIMHCSATGSVSVTNRNIGYQGVGYGGFIGSNDGSITGSAATGDVTITTVNGAENFISSTGIGGFTGSNTGNIADSTATGAVRGVGAGTDGVAGFAGTTDGGSITGSFAGGSVSGPQGALVAGFIGQNLFGNTQLNGNSYNPTTTGQTTAVANGGRGAEDAAQVDRAPDSATVVANRGGDFGASASRAVRRVEFARDVAAARALAADGAPRVANVLTASASAQAAATPRPGSEATAGKRAVEARADAKMEDNLKVEEPPPPASAEQKPRPQRRAVASAPAHKPHGGGQGGAYGARIRSIDVDGQRFDLNRGSATPNNR